LTIWKSKTNECFFLGITDYTCLAV
jgi:hypothetical protein